MPLFKTTVAVAAGEGPRRSSNDDVSILNSCNASAGGRNDAPNGSGDSAISRRSLTVPLEADSVLNAAWIRPSPQCSTSPEPASIAS